MDTAAPAVPARARVASRPLPAATVLASIVAASWLARTLLSLPHDGPLYVPDEYIYAELARSIAETGLPRIRGELAHFPGLLQPILAAPFWLQGDPAVALRATQAFHSLAMSLAAVPVFLTAQLLGLGKRVALATAAVAVAAPGLVYASYLLSDPVGYPLALAAVWAGVRALDRPTPRRELAFFALAGLALATRVQYAFLLAGFVVAVAALERGRGRSLARRYPVTLAAGLAALAVAAVAGPARLLGTYWTGTRGGVDVAGALAWLPTDAMLFAYASGWVIAPGAIVGLAYAAFAPRSRAEAGFAALAGALAAGLFGIAAAVAELDAARFQERYLLALVPVAALAFALAWTRGWRARLGAAALALLLLVVSLRVPLSGYVGLQAVGDSPTLWAVRRAAIEVRSAADGAVVVLLAATVLTLALVVALLRERVTAIAPLWLAVAALASLSVGAHALDARSAEARRAAEGDGPRDWIDRAGLGRVSLLQASVSSRQAALVPLLWNRSVDEVLLLPGTRPPDPFGIVHVAPARDGRIVAGPRVIGNALLVDTYGAAVELSGAELVGRAPGFALWRPDGTPRLSMLALGRYADGWLAGEGRIDLWPDRSGWTRGTLRMAVRVPADEPLTRLRFVTESGTTGVVLGPGARRTVGIEVDVRGPTSIEFFADRYTYDGKRTLSVRASHPEFVRKP